MTGHGEKLSRCKEKAIGALISQPSIPEAAKAIGIGEKTLWRWLQMDDFQQAYLRARRQVVNQAVAKVQAGMTEAVSTLKAVMKDKKSPASARVAAAKTMIDMGLKAIEIEGLELRVEALEKAIKERKI